MNKINRGISLIVLVITIIIMIILAAAIILSLSDSGIIGNAKEAVKSSDIANVKNAKAIIDAEIEIAKAKGQEPLVGTTYDKYIKDKLEEQGIDTSRYYFSETGIVPIPEGFTLSDVEGEKEILTGLVIYEGVDPVTTGTHSTALTTRNQFVWVPVENINDFTRTDFGIGIKGIYFTNNCKEPAEEVFVSGISGATTVLSLSNDRTGEYAEYAAMKSSVEKYGGFYIARYEAGREGTNIIVSRKRAPIWRNKQWGESMTEIGTTEIVYMARTMYKASSSVISTLCYGVQWDSAMKFIAKTDPLYITNSTVKGYYGYDVNGNEIISMMIPSIAGFYKVNNIYDMAGNIYEWTMEAYGSGNRILRGGSYTTNAVEHPASVRFNENPTNYFEDNGFRVALYIK